MNNYDVVERSSGFWVVCDDGPAHPDPLDTLEMAEEVIEDLKAKDVRRAELCSFLASLQTELADNLLRVAPAGTSTDGVTTEVGATFGKIRECLLDEI